MPQYTLTVDRSTTFQATVDGIDAAGGFDSKFAVRFI
jgi:hypothetical protein